MEKSRIQEFFSRVDELLSFNNLKDVPSRLFNVDETGVKIVPQGGKVITMKGTRSVQALTTAERGSNNTIVACCSADGSFVPPMVILKGKRKPNPEALGSLPTGTIVAMSKSGWIDEDIFLLWFRYFLQFLKSVRSCEEKVILFMDGHRSHESVELFKEAVSHNVELIAFPSHTSHYLQPLDVGVFGTFKRSWRERCRQFMISNPVAVISRPEFEKLFSDAWKVAVTPKNALTGFKKSGLCPLDMGVISENVFLISTSLLEDTNRNNGSIH